MIKILRGFLALCLIAVFCAVAFSPGVALAADNAVLSQAIIANVKPPLIEPIGAAGGGNTNPAAYVSMHSQQIFGGRPLGAYENWRMRDTTRNQ